MVFIPGGFILSAGSVGLRLLPLDSYSHLVIMKDCNVMLVLQRASLAPLMLKHP